MAGDAFNKSIVAHHAVFNIAYYVSAHGYGHGVRACDIIRAINELYPDIVVHVVSGLPAGFWAHRIDMNRNCLRRACFDVGMAQIDSIRADVPGTLRALRELYAGRHERLVEEESFLREQKVGVIVVDIPGLPIEAADLVGIPRLAVGNFGWDWIYEEFVSRDAEWKRIVDILRNEYSRTDLLLRLPFCESMSAFPRVEDIPLVASPGICRRSQIAARTGCDPGKKWALLSFTSLGLNEHALNALRFIEGYEFFTVLPLRWRGDNIHALSLEYMEFADIVASMDVVVSKPGYGILSECVVHDKPLIYADRADFREYGILVEAIRKYVRNVHIRSEDLYRGDLEESLNRIWDAPEPKAKPALGGAPIAARRIAGFLL